MSNWRHDSFSERTETYWDGRYPQVKQHKQQHKSELNVNKQQTNVASYKHLISLTHTHSLDFTCFPKRCQWTHHVRRSLTVWSMCVCVMMSYFFIGGCGSVISGDCERSIKQVTTHGCVRATSFSLPCSFGHNQLLPPTTIWNLSPPPAGNQVDCTMWRRSRPELQTSSASLYPHHQHPTQGPAAGLCNKLWLVRLWTQLSYSSLWT